MVRWLVEQYALHAVGEHLVGCAHRIQCRLEATKIAMVADNRRATPIDTPVSIAPVRLPDLDRICTAWAVADEPGQMFVARIARLAPLIGQQTRLARPFLLPTSYLH